MLNKRYNIVVSGTHGKTTTTSLIAYLLKQNGSNPGYLIGGVTRDLQDSTNFGSSKDPFVIEGDEYDSAFFDKRSKFVHYKPNLLVINNMEFDHGDIFRDLQDIQRSFRHLLSIVPKNGIILANGDDPNVEKLFPISWSTIVKVGIGENNNVQIRNFTENMDGSSFDLFWDNKFFIKINWATHGIFNARNAAMAIIATKISLGKKNESFDIKQTKEALKKFKGTKRRQEHLHKSDKLVVIEDFAHHPTAIDNMLTSLKNIHHDAKITICLEPASNTIASTIFETQLAKALAKANEVLIGSPKAKIFSEKFVGNLEKANIHNLASSLNKNGTDAKAFPSNDELLDFLSNNTQKNDTKQIICFLSNGSFSGIIPKYLKSLK